MTSEVRYRDTEAKRGKRLTKDDFLSSGTEHGQQVALFMWANESAAEYPMLQFMFAIPNGGARSPATAANLKAEGTKPGVPDIFLPYPNAGYHGLFIELKRPGTGVKKRRRGRTSAAQVDWIAELQRLGYGACVCAGFEVARQTIIDYINYRRPDVP